ncbi:MAG: Na/Pi symporter, partial [Gammaproteobacteria bacterium]
MYLFKRLTLPAIILALAWGFWTSEDFLRLSAGVAFFMFGMLSLEKGFQAFTGGVLEKVLAASTGTRLRSMGFGLVTTALMQSSSLVSLITITFLSAGLIGLAQGIGIIFGSNIGTTTGAWLMASFGVKIDLAIYAMPMA